MESLNPQQLERKRSSPQAEMPSPPMDAEKPRRTGKMRDACDSCSKKKVRCSKDRPSCERCIDRCVSCVYSPSHRTGRPPRAMGFRRQSRQRNNSLPNNFTNEFEAYFVSPEYQGMAASTTVMKDKACFSPLNQSNSHTLPDAYQSPNAAALLSPFAFDFSVDTSPSNRSSMDSPPIEELLSPPTTNLQQVPVHHVSPAGVVGQTWAPQRKSSCNDIDVDCARVACTCLAKLCQFVLDQASEQRGADSPETGRNTDSTLARQWETIRTLNQCLDCPCASNSTVSCAVSFMLSTAMVDLENTMSTGRLAPEMLWLARARRATGGFSGMV